VCALYLDLLHGFPRATSRRGKKQIPELCLCSSFLRSHPQLHYSGPDAALSPLQHTKPAFLTKMVRNLNTIYNPLHRLNNLCCIALNAFSVCNVFSSLRPLQMFRCFPVLFLLAVVYCHAEVS